ncbi:hypothetical protein RCZ04_21510 [Capnocytophaga sp. HP1101]
MWATYAQEPQLLDRLSAIKNGGKDFYAIDGYIITKEDFNLSFDEKGFKKAYRKLKVTQQEAAPNPRVLVDNYMIVKETNESVESLYFVKNKANNITVIYFAKLRNREPEVEEALVNLIIEDKIPAEKYAPVDASSINFAGRMIPLMGDCYFTGINIVQCPYNGEMNWDIYRTLEDAQQAIADQFTVNTQRRSVKPIQEEEVDVIFEDVPTKAKRVVFDLKGVTSVLAGMSGGKTLTVYYVAQVVRNRPVGCVMSFWNNDNINPATGLPLLLSRVMRLK